MVINEIDEKKWASNGDLLRVCDYFESTFSQSFLKKSNKQPSCRHCKLQLYIPDTYGRSNIICSFGRNFAMRGRTKK